MIEAKATRAHCVARSPFWHILEDDAALARQARASSSAPPVFRMERRARANIGAHASVADDLLRLPESLCTLVWRAFGAAVIYKTRNPE